jgi:hypothetical protein
LSPDLCTGWGEASPTAHPHVGAPVGPRGPASPLLTEPQLAGRHPPGVHKSPTGTGGWATGCARGGDDPAGEQGTRGGDRTTTVHGRRVVHVSTQGDGHRPTAGQQGRLRADLRRGARSPASTPVMTKMKYFSQGVLEPHSGWGRVADRPQEHCSQKRGWPGRGSVGRGWAPHPYRTSRRGRAVQASKGWGTR